MNYGNILNQNEALVSENKTTWSSMTANIDLFGAPYYVALSPIGEFYIKIFTSILFGIPQIQ